MKQKITVLGSTGSHTYLTSDERQHVVTLAAATGTTCHATA